MLISIIVPIYHGKKYIESIITQAEVCATRIASVGKVQLVLSNDAPDDDINGSYISEIIDIITLNTNVNSGIHGARVRGLEKCNGDYVLFLDQDDLIYPDYLVSQIRNIQDADAVVCRLIHENKQYYTNTNSFEGVLNYERMINIGNQIVSPGQVLLKRDSISDAWIHNIMKHNGADDWLLWLCMIAENKKFVLNQDVLFEHVMNGKNASWDSVAMFQSEDEVYEILSKNNVFEDVRLDQLFNAIKKKQISYIHRLEAIRKRFSLYDKWMTLENQNRKLTQFLKIKGYKKIAVYGIGDVGKILVGRLCFAEELSICAIDRNAEYIEAGVPVYKLEDFEDDVDLVVITLVDNPQKMIYPIRQKIDAEVLTLEELLDMWEQE